MLFVAVHAVLVVDDNDALVLSLLLFFLSEEEKRKKEAQTYISEEQHFPLDINLKHH